MSNLKNLIFERLAQSGKVIKIITKGNIVNEIIKRDVNFLITLSFNRSQLNLVVTGVYILNDDFYKSGILNSTANIRMEPVRDQSSSVYFLQIHTRNFIVKTKIPYNYLYDFDSLDTLERISFERESLMFPYYSLNGNDSFVEYDLMLPDSFHEENKLENVNFSKKLFPTLNVNHSNILEAAVSRKEIPVTSQIMSLNEYRKYIQEHQLTGLRSLFDYFTRGHNKLRVTGYNKSVEYFGLKSKKEMIYHQNPLIDSNIKVEKLKSSKFGVDVNTILIDGTRFLVEEIGVMFNDNVSLINAEILTRLNKYIIVHIKRALRKGDEVNAVNINKFKGHLLPDKKYIVENIEKINDFDKVVTISGEFGKIKCYEKSLKLVENTQNNEEKTYENGKTASI